MKKSIFIIPIILSCYFLSSCATIFGGSQYYAQVVIKDRPNAKIYKNGVYIGTGKGYAMIKRNVANQVHFSIEEEGYQKEFRSFNNKIFRGWSLAGSLATIIPLWPVAAIATIVDASTGAWWKPDINERGVIKTDFRHYNYVLEYERKPIKKVNKVVVKKTKKENNDLRNIEEKLRDLKKLLDEGILTQEEFAMMKKKFIGLEDPNSGAISNLNRSKINDLDNMLAEGILTKTEYDHMRKKVDPNYKSITKKEKSIKEDPKYEALTTSNKAKIKDLDNMLAEGTLTLDEYNHMRKKVEPNYQAQETKKVVPTSDTVGKSEIKEISKPIEEKTVPEEEESITKREEKKETQKLQDLNKMLEFGIISEEEYNEMKEKLKIESE